MGTGNHGYKIVFRPEAVARGAGIDIESRRQAGNDDDQGKRSLYAVSTHVVPLNSVSFHGSLGSSRSLRRSAGRSTNQ